MLAYLVQNKKTQLMRFFIFGLNANYLDLAVVIFLHINYFVHFTQDGAWSPGAAFAVMASTEADKFKWVAKQ